MREIRFRMWNGQYMINSEYASWVSFDGVIYKEADKTYNTPNIEIEKDKSKPVLMQFTGLQDKNGKDICEGDILQTKSDKLMVVDWSQKFASFILKREDWAFSHWFGESCEPKDCVIVGNIHQNPELLS